jgi:exonuclease SbcC
MARPEFEADAEVFCRQLNEKFERFRDLQTHLAEARQKLRTLEAQKPQVSKDFQLAADELEQRTNDFNTAQKKLDDLRRQLHELLGERTVEEFEQEIKDREKSEREKLDNAKNDRIKAEKQLTAATTHNNAMQKQLITAGQNEDAARSNLNRWLAEFSPQRGSDEALSELQQLLNYDGSWIQRERDDLDQLAGNVNTAQGHADSCQQRLDELLRQRTDDREEAAVCLAVESQKQIVRNAEADKQEAARVLKNDDDTIGKNSELDRRIEAASKQAEPWRKLSDLIGSADGKKFTLMAQRYTLDLLLQHANVQLRELARRYRLERLGDSLNLGVIDQDLGDELRSVHSLSGGETFLVSLALALGLASLTSSRLRIESLFIDEGFGSLDEDTLETAMNALNHLQSQGRKVGIITHVERMQDAITTQIHVRRGPGGSSRIVLPQAVEGAQG